MNDHLSTEQINRYQRKELGRPELLAVDKHLSACEVCRGKLDVGAESIVASFRREFSAEPDDDITHLSFEQLADYVDGKLDAVDQAIAESHLEICKRCQAELEDLKAFQQEIAPARPLMVVRPKRWTPILLRVAAIAAVMAFVAWASTMTLHNRIRELDKQLQQADSEIQKLRAERDKRITDSMLVAFQDAGGRVFLDRQGNLHGLEFAAPGDQAMVRTVLVTKKIQTPSDLENLITKSGIVLGESQEGVPFALLAPVGTIVLNNRPVFRWEPLAGAQKYRVTVLDSSFSTAADSGWIQDTSWTAENPLRRGNAYIWQVTALQEGREVSSPQPPAGEAWFQILDQPRFEQLEQARASQASSHLLLGLLYAQHGVLDNAEKELQLLTAANPDSKEAKELLLQLQKLR